MAKLKNNYEFKNAIINLEEMVVVEYDKDGVDELGKYPLEPILEKIASMGFVDLAINSTGIPSPIAEEEDLNAFGKEESDFYLED